MQDYFACCEVLNACMTAAGQDAAELCSQRAAAGALPLSASSSLLCSSHLFHHFWA